MRVLAIVHQEDCGPGVFADAIRAAGADLDSWFLPRDSGPPGDPFEYEAVITLGGAMHADQNGEHPWLAREKELLEELLAREVPLLGVCLGAQLLAQAAGATARRAAVPEIGWYEIETTDDAPVDHLIGPLGPRFEALEWHSYECQLPVGATPLARSSTCLQAYRVGERAWGIQFHAEVTAPGLEAWIDDYRSDPDAVAMDLDAKAFRSRSRRAIGTWNALGRELCERFLGVATARRSSGAAGA